MRGKKINPEAIKWLLSHPKANAWTDRNLAQALKNAGIYSLKTYIGDIRVPQIRAAAAKQVRQLQEILSHDIRRLDWLSENAHNMQAYHIQDLILSDDADSVAFRNGMRISLFTINSQHVYGQTLRAAIDAAMSLTSGAGASENR